MNCKSDVMQSTCRNSIKLLAQHSKAWPREAGGASWGEKEGKGGCDGKEGRGGRAGPGTAWPRLSWPGAAHLPVVGVKRSPWSLDNMPPMIETNLANKNAIFTSLPKRGFSFGRNCQAACNANCFQGLLQVHRG